MKFTFIMPAYNAENTIEKAVRSIMGQTYNDIQILIIDDGSQDRTLDIIKSLAQEDSRIEYYHKENGGIGSAFILAFKKILGDYCFLVDSDDYIDNNLAEDIKHTIDSTNADIVQYGLKRYDENGNKLSSVTFSSKELSGTDIVLKDYFYGCSRGENFPGLSTRVVRSSFYMDFDYYSSSLSIDEVLAVHVLSKTSKIVFLNKEYYNVVMYQSSVSRAPVTSQKVVGQFKGLSLIPNIVSKFDKEIQTLAAIKLLSFIANFYIYFVDGYGRRFTNIKVKELYALYHSNINLVNVPLKTKFTLFSLRYIPIINLLKNKINHI